MTIEEVAENLHISVGTARNRLSSGSGAMPPSIKSGRRRLFPLSRYNEWLDSLHREQNPDIQNYEGRQGRGRPVKITRGSK